MDSVQCPHSICEIFAGLTRLPLPLSITHTTTTMASLLADTEALPLPYINEISSPGSNYVLRSRQYRASRRRQLAIRLTNKRHEINGPTDLAPGSLRGYPIVRLKGPLRPLSLSFFNSSSYVDKIVNLRELIIRCPTGRRPTPSHRGGMPSGPPEG
jgi:hypothetical protein